jgi:hypothetical protein
MKTRQGFVSNSSSSSFCIRTTDLTPVQIQQIHDHPSLGKELGFEYTEDEWLITIDDYWLRGSTIMDNFDMWKFLVKIGIDPNLIVMDSENYR